MASAGSESFFRSAAIKQHIHRTSSQERRRRSRENFADEWTNESYTLGNVVSRDRGKKMRKRTNLFLHKDNFFACVYFFSFFSAAQEAKVRCTISNFSWREFADQIGNAYNAQCIRAFMLVEQIRLAFFTAAAPGLCVCAALSALTLQFGLIYCVTCNLRSHSREREERGGERERETLRRRRSVPPERDRTAHNFETQFPLAETTSLLRGMEEEELSPRQPKKKFLFLAQQKGGGVSYKECKVTKLKSNPKSGSEIHV